MACRRPAPGLPRRVRRCVHRLTDEGYLEGGESALFPALDLAGLARLVVPGTSLTAAVAAFRTTYRDA